jgi:hypothetical protein
VTSLEISRASNLSYKTAFRMTHLIRSLFHQNIDGFPGGRSFEIDETYMGDNEKNKYFSNRNSANQGRSLKTKTAIIGILNKNKGTVKTVIASKINGYYIR